MIFVGLLSAVDEMEDHDLGGTNQAEIMTFSLSLSVFFCEEGDERKMVETKVFSKFWVEELLWLYVEKASRKLRWLVRLRLHLK